MQRLTTSQRQSLEITRDSLQLQALLSAAVHQDQAEKLRRLAAILQSLSMDRSAQDYGAYLANCWVGGALRRDPYAIRRDETSNPQSAPDSRADRRRAGNTNQAWTRAEQRPPDQDRRRKAN